MYAFVIDMKVQAFISWYSKFCYLELCPVKKQHFTVKIAESNVHLILCVLSLKKELNIAGKIHQTYKNLQTQLREESDKGYLFVIWLIVSEIFDTNSPFQADHRDIFKRKRNNKLGIVRSMNLPSFLEIFGVSINSILGLDCLSGIA